MNVYKTSINLLHTYKNSLIYLKNNMFYTNRTSYNKIRHVGSILELHVRGVYNRANHL